MSLILSAAPVRFTLLAFALVLLSFVFAPQHASAAAVSLSTATTSSNNASTTLAKVGDTVSYRLVLSGTPSATTTPVINIFSMGTTSMSGSGTTWTYSTTSASAWTSGFVTFYMAWGGSAGEATTTISQTSLTSANVEFDKTAPTISSITSSATASGVLKVGDTITFTLATSSTERYGSVSGSYNSQSLTWSLSGVSTFTSTYTVAEGETDRTSALQISSVLLTDAAGNASSAGAGSDIAKTIDANSPSLPAASPAAGTFFSASQSITLSSSGSDSIYYTQDGTSPSCSSGSLYSAAFSIAATKTIKAIGCDTAGNTSSISSSVYTQDNNGGGGGGSSRSRGATPAVVVASNPGIGGGQITAIINLLKSFGADQSIIERVEVALAGKLAEGAPAGSGIGIFVRDLGVGSVGEDVRALQIFLNTHGFEVASAGTGSAGNETTIFGALTRAAVAKFQASKGITPAVGRFGPKTRAAVSAMQ